MTETFHAGPGLGRLSDVTIIHGDCIEAMAELAADSVDAIVTDPPYGLEFMGKDWDSFAPQNTTAQRSNAGGFGDDETKPWNKARSGTKGVRTTFRCRSCNGWSGSFSEARAARQKECKCDSPDLNYAGAPPQTVAFGKWCELWTTEALRVLKPGGHMLAFGGTRTWHRLAVAVEDAGFEIRDSIAWLYGSGFPKSLDVSKAIDKAAGATREKVQKPGAASAYSANAGNDRPWMQLAREQGFIEVDGDAPATPEAEQWSGWGTALKPAFEPVVVARKPLVGTVAANVLAHGTGALNIDATRIGTTDSLGGGANKAMTVETRHEGWGRPWMQDDTARDAAAARSADNTAKAEALGRWPANVVLDADSAQRLDEQSGTSKSSSRPRNNTAAAHNQTSSMGKSSGDWVTGGHDDSGGASRFFYVAKAPKKERPVVEARTERAASCRLCDAARADGIDPEVAFVDPAYAEHVELRHAMVEVAPVSHPTVKPLALMRWLVRLVTPPGGIVLDPFSGSGTTIEAALLEDFRVIGIEREADYLPMIQQRIARVL